MLATVTRGDKIGNFRLLKRHKTAHITDMETLFNIIGEAGWEVTMDPDIGLYVEGPRGQYLFLVGDSGRWSWELWNGPVIQESGEWDIWGDEPPANVAARIMEVVSRER